MTIRELLELCKETEWFMDKEGWIRTKKGCQCPLVWAAEKRIGIKDVLGPLDFEKAGYWLGLQKHEISAVAAAADNDDDLELDHIWIREALEELIP